MKLPPRGSSGRSGGASRSHRDSELQPQVPPSGATRSQRLGWVIEFVPAPVSTALKRTQRTSLGVATRGDLAPGQDSRRAGWEVESPQTGSRCSEGVRRLPAPVSTALKRTQRTSLGVATRGDLAPGQDSRRAGWEVESPPTVSRCSEGVRLAPGVSVG